MILPP